MTRLSAPWRSAKICFAPAARKDKRLEDRLLFGQPSAGMFECTASFPGNRWPRSRAFAPSARMRTTYHPGIRHPDRFRKGDCPGGMSGELGL